LETYAGKTQRRVVSARIDGAFAQDDASAARNRIDELLERQSHIPIGRMTAQLSSTP